MKKLILLLVSMSVLGLSYGNMIRDTLYISPDTLQKFGSVYHFKSFVDSDSSRFVNVHFNLNTFDTLMVVVINKDSINHSFTIDGFIETGNEVLPNDSVEFQFSTVNKGTYRYYSSNPSGELLGASGIITVGYVQYAGFFWNLFEAEAGLSDSVAMGGISFVPDAYSPELFMINGYHYPNTQTDPVGSVNGAVGDSIIISIVNSGNMTHSLHFHGYHVDILHFKGQEEKEGWTKDSFAVRVHESATVLLIPHQSGLYPVHDHNLISVTNSGVYPGGMITVLNISP